MEAILNAPLTFPEDAQQHVSAECLDLISKVRLFCLMSLPSEFNLISCVTNTFILALEPIAV